ncbi:spartin-like isoform X2 [Labeo rohita]|uniref:Spartin n=1 Tax=Labeo rohita TaxID=84645 RepID=A0A498L7D2_LABRO|nr:spartin a isoform X1 [Labeo rohita]RXN04291.1 spartin-like isoform X2 [Labeo rohita]RXN32569.1 spartin-like isoform X2 [Labeo rohita]
MESTQPAEIRTIRENYGKALQCLNKGLQYDDAGNKDQALLLYRLGRRHLLKGLEVNTHGKRCVGRHWDLARQTQQRMNETLSTISDRLQVLESTANRGQRLYPTLTILQDPQPVVRRTPLLTSGGASAQPASPAAGITVPAELPPAYTPQPTEGHLSLSHGGNRPFRAAPTQTPQRQAFAPVNLREVGMEILFLPRGVQMFFVSAEGHVSAPSYPGYLRIIIYNSQNSSAGYAPAYLQVCDWIYPLYPDSPVFLSNKGVFTFPDTTAAVPGSYVGVVLSSELPAADRVMFQDQLSALAQLRVQVNEEQGGATGTDLSGKVPPSETSLTPGGEEKTLPVWSEKMSQSILSGTSWLGRGLVRGGEATGKVIHKGGTKLRENITPEETPAEVSPKVTKSLNAAKQATGGAVKVSQFLVDGVAAVAGRVGKEVAPHMKKHGSKLIPESLKKSKGGCSNMDGAKLVAGSSIQGLSTLWSSLETAAKTVGKSITSETVTTVRHKYGDDAGQAADTAVQSAVNVGVTAFNLDNLVVKGVLKATGKQTAEALVKDGSGREGTDKKEMPPKKGQNEKK